MKILIITPYVTIEDRPTFEKNKTGFGYMVMDIAKAVGKMETVHVLTTNTLGESFEYEGVTFLQRSIIAFLGGLFNCLSLGILFSLRKFYSMGYATFIRTAYYCLMTGYLKNIIKKGDYDIVHIHGCGLATELWMMVCKLCNQKFVVTLHGLNSFSDTVKLEPSGKQYERNFLKRTVDGEFPITVISTGMKKLIERTYGVLNCTGITVVCNSFSFAHTQTSRSNRSIREKYIIPQDAKILLYVGNISENKNQRQMVDAYCLLPEDMKNNTWVLFCGRYSINGGFEDYVSSKPYNDHLVLCGAVEKTKMSYYYKEADGIVLLSHVEGFGLSLVEGMSFGVPCAMFSDMDAFEDIYDEKAVVAIAERKNETVVDGLVALLSKNWNKKEIIKSSQRFESKTMAQSYIKVYQNILK